MYEDFSSLAIIVAGLTPASMVQIRRTHSKKIGGLVAAFRFDLIFITNLTQLIREIPNAMLFQPVVGSLHRLQQNQLSWYQEIIIPLVGKIQQLLERQLFAAALR